LTSFKDIEIYAKGMSNIPVEVFLTLFEQMVQYNGASVLERIECPTLIIAGKKDTVTPIQHQELLHNKIKGSEFMAEKALRLGCTLPKGFHVGRPLPFTTRQCLDSKLKEGNG
jgi:pimeloyl-ACP methyl ester carboxylesterase